MANNDKLHRKLKAADRRRARRPQTPATGAPQASAETLSAARRLDDAILSAILGTDNAHAGMTDRDLRSALQSALRGGRPSGDAAQAMLAALQQVHQSHQPAARLWRDALNQLLQTATDYEENDARGRNYLQFLQTIAS